MTNEEMERAIDFLLKSQANYEARLKRQLEQQEAERARREAERAQREAEQAQYEAQRKAEQVQRDARFDKRFELTNQQIAETEKKLSMVADTLNDFIRVVTHTFDEQARINKSVAESLKRLAESQAHTDRRLDALIDIVRGGRNGG